jgi:hypothetical protein
MSIRCRSPRGMPASFGADTEVLPAAIDLHIRAYLSGRGAPRSPVSRAADRRSGGDWSAPGGLAGLILMV